MGAEDMTTSERADGEGAAESKWQVYRKTTRTKVMVSHGGFMARGLLSGVAAPAGEKTWCRNSRMGNPVMASR